MCKNDCKAGHKISKFGVEFEENLLYLRDLKYNYVLQTQNRRVYRNSKCIIVEEIDEHNIILLFLFYLWNSEICFGFDVRSRSLQQDEKNHSFLPYHEWTIHKWLENKMLKRLFAFCFLTTPNKFYQETSISHFYCLR